ncbi:Tuftelin-interacting protein 11 [Chamberlinius hualienensis]
MLKGKDRLFKQSLSMAEVEFEKFEITDYDLENEFNPNRVRRKFTKKQQIYGIFADDASDDERPSFSRGKDYSFPINFVGGGIEQAGKKPEEPPKDEVTDSDSSIEEVPAIKPVKKSEFSNKGRQRFSGLNSEDDFGKWEKHTKGIGMKLLLQHGYKPGGGLGKDLQGISQPIEAKQRKGRGAVGAYGSENVKQNLKPHEVVVDSEGDDSQEARNRSGQWKKSEEGKRKKIKYAYKTIDDVMAEGSRRKLATEISRLSKVKVIDMTGPEQRVLSGYHAIHSQHSKPQESEVDKGSKTSQQFALPELMHNLNLLVDMTEQQILRSGRELSYERDQIVNMTHETENLNEMIAVEKKQIYALETLVEMIDKLENSCNNTSVKGFSLSDAAKIIREIQDRFYNEYQMYGLSDLAVVIAVPMFKKLFENWKPLEDDVSFGMKEAKEWKDLLENSSVTKSYAQDKVEPYDQLIWEAWMPALRTTVLIWNCRDCNPLIDLIINWMPLLPAWILNNILELVVLPRLQQEVDNWNPLTDHVPIDAWIHPWLSVMSNQLEILYPTIRHKLANGLTSWHPSDGSAKRILVPWKGIFPPGTLEAFLIKNVLPKLAFLLQQFVINPVQQHLEPWQWVMTWEDMIPVSSMVALLEKHFFPKWMQVLCSWLGHNPNYEEISNWYTGWKKMIPPNILAHPTIKDYFNRALDVMNNAVSAPLGIGFPPMGPQEHMAYWESLNRRKQMDNAMPNRAYEVPTQSTSNVSMTFKDLVERRAMENGLVFLPIPNRYHEAKQIYRFGNQVICIDRSVIFLQREHTWVPSSLQSLVDIAK